MKASYDPIRILLIDDLPQNLCGEPIWEYPLAMDDPDYPLKFSGVFEVRFLATAEEAREFRDRSLLLAHSQPETFSREGWIPEIVVADYMLTGETSPIETRDPTHFDLLSPLPPLRQYTGDNFSESAAKAKFDGKRIPQEQESYGCFAAGLICSTFSEHPCGLVTRTKRTPGALEGTYVEYFQWLMASQVANWLQPELPIPRDWRAVLKIAVPRLRARIENLVRQRILVPSLFDLMALADDGKHEVLTIESRYGVRRLPVKGLFCDEPYEDIQVAAHEWATDMLEGIARACFDKRIEADGKIVNLESDLKKAAELANHIWSNGYSSWTRMKDRFELAALWNCREDNKEFNEARLKTLIGAFQHAHTEAKDVNLDEVKDIERFVELRTEGYAGLSQRWAALMLIVRLMQWVHQARDMATQSDDQALQGPEIHADLQDKDAYLALFPISKGPLGLRDEDKNSAASRGGAWGRTLQRLNDPRFPRLQHGRNNDGNLGLSIEDVLSGHDWQDGVLEGVVWKSGGTKGMTPGERYLMQCYARALPTKYHSGQWDKQARKIFYGERGVL